MNLLDRLFSREIERRTGAHAVNVYVDYNTKAKAKLRSVGAQTLQSASKTKVITKKNQGSLFHRLDVRFPWLKLATIVIVGVIAIIDLLDFTISQIGDPVNTIRIAPMSHHVRATNRDYTNKKLVALTFDDGPSAATTPQLLDVLSEKDVLATFFMLGSAARNQPELVKRAKKEGHEIASHTMYHQNLIRIPFATASDDVKESSAVFTNILGQDVSLVRPPYGNTNSAISGLINKPLILWSVDTEDWLHKNASESVRIAMSQVYDGAIILMHDIYPSSVEAVPTLIDTLREAGYEFVTVPELAKFRHAKLKNSEVYYSIRP